MWDSQTHAALRKAEAQLGREVNVTNYGVADLRKEGGSERSLPLRYLREHKLLVNATPLEWYFLA